jgi:very-short-patch-repair endonuclease
LLRAPGPQIHLTLVDRRSPTPRPGVTVHRAKSLTKRDLTRIDGLPTTTPLRTIVDLAALATTMQLQRAVDEAEVRNLLTREAIREHAPSRHRGATTLRSICEADRALTRSEAEDLLLALIARAGLPPPLVNTRVGPYEVDALWPHRRVIAEVDGYAFHRTRTAFERDRSRDADLEARGYTVVRITWRQLTDESEAVAIRLARLLEAQPT